MNLGGGLGINVHAHMLRHACGFKLANDGVGRRHYGKSGALCVRTRRVVSGVGPEVVMRMFAG